MSALPQPAIPHPRCFDLSSVVIDLILGRHIARLGVFSRRSRQRLKHRRGFAPISDLESFCKLAVDRSESLSRFFLSILPCLPIDLAGAIASAARAYESYDLPKGTIRRSPVELLGPR